MNSRFWKMQPLWDRESRRKICERGVPGNLFSTTVIYWYIYIYVYIKILIIDYISVSIYIRIWSFNLIHNEQVVNFLGSVAICKQHQATHVCGRLPFAESIEGLKWDCCELPECVGKKTFASKCFQPRRCVAKVQKKNSDAFRHLWRLGFLARCRRVACARGAIVGVAEERHFTGATAWPASLGWSSRKPNWKALKHIET